MDITFNCDQCGQSITIDVAGAGLSVQCPKCDANLIVPKAETNAPFNLSAPPVVSVATPPPIVNGNAKASSATTLINCSACGKQISSAADSCPSCGQPNKSKKITCPNCRSGNVQRIRMESKVGAAVLFGVFAMGRLTKTWECNDCKFKW